MQWAAAVVARPRKATLTARLLGKKNPAFAGFLESGVHDLRILEGAFGNYTKLQFAIPGAERKIYAVTNCTIRECGSVGHNKLSIGPERGSGRRLSAAVGDAPQIKRTSPPGRRNVIGSSECHVGVIEPA